MKVYIALSDCFIGETYICVCKKGEELYEDGFSYKQKNGGLILTKRQVEEDEHFELVREDCRNADYYIRKVYTQADVDKLLAKNENNY